MLIPRLIFYTLGEQALEAINLASSPRMRFTFLEDAIERSKAGEMENTKVFEITIKEVVPNA